MPKPPSDFSAVPRDPGTISSTILDGLRRQDRDAWDRMVKLFSPLVYEWCRRDFRLQPDDAKDIVQDVFIAVYSGLAGFHRDKPGDTFRGWVWTITRNKVYNWFRDNGKEPCALGGTTANQQLQQFPGQHPLEVEEPSGAGRDRGLVWRALESIRGDFTDTTWQAFWGMTIDSRSAADMAAELGITPDAVRQAKARVLRRLRQELEGLLRVQRSDLARYAGWLHRASGRSQDPGA